MKNKIIVLFLFSLLIPIHFSSAYIPLPSSTDFGGSANPINIQIQPNYTEQLNQQNLSLQSQLKIQYGYSIYSSCKSSVCGSYNAIDPVAESSCLSMLESWLGSNRCLAQRQQANENTQCDDGYEKVLVNGWYQCNKIKTNEPTTLPPGCSSTLYFSATTGISCDGTNKCGVGSQFNSDKTECIPTTKATPKATTPIIKKVQEVKENTTNINQPDPVNLNQAVTTSTPPEVKPKSFWTRLIGWLGF